MTGKADAVREIGQQFKDRTNAVIDGVLAHLRDDNAKEILGGGLSPLIGRGSLKSIVTFALYADVLRMVHDVLAADGEISEEEVQASLGLLKVIAAGYAKVRKEYAAHAALQAEAVRAFLSQYRVDKGPFGHANEATRWAGVALCRNVSEQCDDGSPLQALGTSLLAWAELLMGSDGADDRERKAVDAIRALVQETKTPAGTMEAACKWFVDPGHTMFRLRSGLVQILVQPLVGNIGITKVEADAAQTESGCPEGFEPMGADDARKVLQLLGQAIQAALSGGDLTLEFPEWPRGSGSLSGSVDDEEDDDASEDECGDDEQSDAIDEDISPHFESEDWPLPTSGNVPWSEVVAYAGEPRESSLLTLEEWRQAIAESRVVSVLHDGDGSGCIGLVGHGVVGRQGNYCRVVFDQPIAPDITLIDVDVSDINCDFEGASEEADEQGKRLLDACRTGDLAGAKEAIRLGANLEYEDFEDEPRVKPLVAAIQSGATDIVGLLLGSGLKPESVHHAWILAASIGRGDIAGLLAKAGFEVSPGAALLHACRIGRSDVIQQFAKSVDLNQSHMGGDPWLDGTALVIAARHGQHDAVSTLLRLGAAAGSVDSNGITPWVAAAASGNGEIANLLVENGAKKDIDHALLTACSWGNVRAIRTLLAQGANPKAQVTGRRGETTPLFACMNNSTWLDDEGNEVGFNEADHRRSEAVDALCSSGADPSAVSTDGERPLHAAVRMMCRGAIPVLLKYGADVDAKDSEGDTPLIKAIESGKAGEMWRLLQAGADPNCSDKKGNPAVFAMFREYGAFNATLVKTLLAFGVDLDVKNAKGASLRKRCQKAVDNPDAEGGSAESAQEVLDLLEDTDSRARFHNLMRRPAASPDDLVALCNCVTEVLDDASELPPIIDDFVKTNGAAAALGLAEMCRAEDWRVREQAVRAIERHVGEKVPLASVLDGLVLCSFDNDSDVRNAADRLFLAHADEAVPLVVRSFVESPVAAGLAGNLLGLFEAQRPSIIAAIGKSLLPNPSSLTGIERIAEGRKLSVKATLEAEQDPEQAIKDASLAVTMEPSLELGPWASLAALKSQRGDDSLQNAIDLYSQAKEADDWGDERDFYDQAIAADPAFVWPYNNIAWHLATAADPAERSGAEAVRFATKACELDGYLYWSFLDTLAAAHAENGDYRKAVEFATKALAGCPSDTTELEALLERYQSGQSYPYPEQQEDDEAESEWGDGDDE